MNDGGLMFGSFTKSVTLELPDPVLPKQELRRRAVLPSAPESEVQELAVKAGQLLGYHVLSAHVNAPGVLAQTLRELDIAIFNEAEVRRYKSYMASEVDKKLGDPRQGARWTTANIKYYKEPVPEFVLRKAIQVKEKLPRVEFIIDYLTIGFKSVDPFLIASHQISDGEQEQYYIEVWDEPEFEIKL